MTSSVTRQLLIQTVIIPAWSHIGTLACFELAASFGWRYTYLFEPCHFPLIDLVHTLSRLPYWVLLWNRADLLLQPENFFYYTNNQNFHSRLLKLSIKYRVFIIYCAFFSKNFHYFVTSPSSALGCDWLYRKWPANKSNCTLRSDELLSYMHGMGCSESGKDTIFNEHPVPKQTN